MMAVLETPPFNTVQDPGSDLARGYGFGPAGAMDPLALRIGNALLGNPDTAAALELQMFPIRLRLLAPCRFAITGSARAELDDAALPPWWQTRGLGDQTLTVHGLANGARGYLAVQGGIDVPEVLGSRSTRPAGFGGLNGRALQPGDVIRAGGPTFVAGNETGFGVPPPESVLGSASPGHDAVGLRLLPSAEFDSLDAASRRRLWDTDWRLDAKSNRQGFRLAGPPLQRQRAVEMRSYPLIPGALQLTSAGSLIVQMSDTNAAGGYPLLGAVIGADLWRLAQCRPGRAIRFRPCHYHQAVAAQRRLEAWIEAVRRAALPALAG